MEEEITFKDFVDSENLRLQEFGNYWEEKHQEDPETYPLLMTLGDWDDQFNCVGEVTLN